MKIIDTPWHTTNALDCLKSNDIAIVIRYYNNGNSHVLPEKLLELDEATALSAAGFRIGVIYQISQNKASDFNAEKGQQAGTIAFNYAKNTIGQPAHSAIYFAVDYNATQSDLDNNIIPYFQAVQQAFSDLSGGGPVYRIGAYGSGLVCNTLKDQGLCDFRWLSQSSSFSGTQEAIDNGDYELRQLYPSSKICNIDVDTDEKKSPATNIGTFVLHPVV